MGFASKLAASAGPAPVGYASAGAPPPQQGSGGYPGQPQYQAYSGSAQPQAKPQPQFQQNPRGFSSALNTSPHPQAVPGRQSPYPDYPSQSPHQTYPPSSPYSQQNQQYNRPPPPPPGYPQDPYGQPPPQYPPQSPYTPSGQYYNQPPPQQSHNSYGPYGAPQQTRGQYPPQGAPQIQASPAQIAAYEQLLLQCIQDNSLQTFYPPGHPRVKQIASIAAPKVNEICSFWKLPREVGNDIVKLALFDIILYIDDSGSMAFEEEGERIEDLKAILRRVAYAATLFDEDGISIRFMNQACSSDDLKGKSPASVLPANLVEHIKNDQQIEQLMSQKKFSGLTPMGSQLREKVLDGIISRGGTKPFLVITITDGQPAGENTNEIFETIKYAQSKFPRGAVQFAFAQVGNDQKAREFLAKLDNDPQVGHLVDCTSNYESEQAEMSSLPTPVDLTPELWLMKLLLGAIDHSYDKKDEKSGSGPPGGYGAPPAGPGAPQYGQYPPQGQYPPPGQQGYSPPGQYGGPPQQGQYYGGPPPPQGQYGGPPPGQYPPQGYSQQPPYPGRR